MYGIYNVHKYGYVLILNNNMYMYMCHNYYTIGAGL